jgi:hypothetical protein
MRRSITTLILLLVTIPIGLAVRLLPLGLPWFLYITLATIAILIATLLELSRLIPIAPIDAFRLTFAGKILLGHYFSIKNIAAYIFAIALTAVLDNSLVAPESTDSHPDHTPNPSNRDTL